MRNQEKRIKERQILRKEVEFSGNKSQECIETRCIELDEI